jgi:hypothetical protein
MSDLKNDLQTIADRHAQQSGGDFETVLRTATSRRRRRFVGVSAAACAVVAVGAIATLTPWQNADDQAPVASKPTLDPKYAGMMTITPATAAPGAQIGLTYPKGYLRGLGFTLAEPDGGKLLYYLAAGHAGSKPTWKAAGGDTIGGPDLGIVGAGPDLLVVPDTAADGTYLLCTSGTRVQACALLTVAG